MGKALGYGHDWEVVCPLTCGRRDRHSAVRGRCEGNGRHLCRLLWEYRVGTIHTYMCWVDVKQKNHLALYLLSQLTISSGTTYLSFGFLKLLNREN